MYRTGFWKNVVLNIMVLLLIVSGIPSWAFAEETLSAAATVAFEVEDVIEGDTPQEDVPFTFVLAREDANGTDPLPENTTATITGAGSAQFEAITFTESGEYNYSVQEIAGNQEGYTYDSSTYHIKVKVGYSRTEGMKAICSVRRNDETGKSQALSFVNEYQHVPETEAPGSGDNDGSGDGDGAGNDDAEAGDDAGSGDDEGMGNAQVEADAEQTRVQVIKQDENGAPVEGALLRIVDSEGKMMDEWTTDGTTHTTPDVLTVGETYRLVEIQEPDGYKVSEDISFTVKENGATDPVVMVDEKADAGTGSAHVTKHLTMLGEPMAAYRDYYYVALFEDEACTKRVTSVRTLEFICASYADTVFQNLEVGKTYYVSETDKNGTALRNGVLETGEIYSAYYSSGQEFTVQKDTTAELSFDNQFLTLPQYYYLEGILTITKKVEGADGQPENSNDIFYVGIYSDPSYTQLADNVSENVVAISLNGSSEASASIYVALPDKGSSTLYVTEIDETGKPVEQDSSFPYQLTVSQNEVTLTMLDDYLKDVVLTNREYPETEEETEPETEWITEPETTPETEPETVLETEPQTQPQTSPATRTETEAQSETTAKSVKTGDQTPIELYILLLGASAVVILIGEGYRRHRKSKS
jgi:pilin isopeptide linkage protein